MKRIIIALLSLALIVAHGAAQGQQAPAPKPAPKRVSQNIEIRGQAPTPQVVTVRPREVPTYKPSSLPQTVMTSGAWPAISSAYSVTPIVIMAGKLSIDTTAAGLARGGASGAAVAAGAAAGAAAAGAPGAAGAAMPGASSEEIEAMRRDMAVRRARLDSLEKAYRDNAARTGAAGASAAAAGGRRMSPADSAARANEINAIRKELKYRMARLDSLQKEVNNLGGGPPKQQKKKSSAKTDTTKSSPSGKPPRGIR